MRIPVKRLIKLASKSDHSRFYHATIIVKGSNIIGYGYNHGYTHSECDALYNVWPNKRIGATAINLRITKTGRFGNSKPCDNCRIALRKSGIKKIYFTDSDGVFKLL